MIAAVPTATVPTAAAQGGITLGGPVPTLVGLLLGGVTLYLIQSSLRCTELRPHRDWREWAASAAVVSVVAVLCSAMLSHDRGYGLLVLIVFGVAASAVDLIESRLPDQLTTGIAAGAAGIVAADSIISASPAPASRAAFAAAAIGAGALLYKRLRPNAIGWGDVKLLVGLAAVLGWWTLEAVLVAIALWGLGIVATALATLPGPQRWSVIPYGPALLLGSLGALALTE